MLHRHYIYNTIIAAVRVRAVNGSGRRQILVLVPQLMVWYNNVCW